MLDRLLTTTTMKMTTSNSSREGNYASNPHVRDAGYMSTGGNLSGNAGRVVRFENRGQPHQK